MNMKTNRNVNTTRKTILYLPMAALLITTALVGAASAKELVPFRGAVEGIEDFNFKNDGSGIDLNVLGSGGGHATGLGRFTVTWDADITFTNPDNPMERTFVAANGDELYAEGRAAGTPPEDGFQFVTETMTITGGTGRFEFADGSFTLQRGVFEIGELDEVGEPDFNELPTFGSFDGFITTVDRLLAGDADQDWDFDQLDMVQVQVAAKYLTGQAATWGEGDWNGAPGGEPGNPPTGDGLFNQFDIIAAQQGAIYLTGPYAAVQSNGTLSDGQTSVVYNADTGEIAVDAPAGAELTSINIDSASGIFTGEAAANLGGSFDNDADDNIFKATFGSSFGSLSFGNVAQAGLSEEFMLGDLSVIGSLTGGGELGDVDLVYVPEPSTLAMLVFGMLLGLRRFRRMA